MRRSMLVSALIVLSAISGSAWAQEAPESDDDDTADTSSDRTDAPTPPPPATPEAPLAVPASTPAPPATGAQSGAPPLPLRTPARTGVRPAPERAQQTSTGAPLNPALRGSNEPDPTGEPSFFVDAGYRVVWIGDVNIPTRRTPSGEPARAHLIHGQFTALLDKNISLGLTYEMPANGSRAAFPFVAEARIGWWDNAFGEPVRRGPFQTLPGMAMTYVGWRWVHDHYRGRGGEWAGTADAAGLVLGYTRAAPLGRLTIVTDTQFSLYLAGWKNRAEFPLGLLNQRLSFGFDPIFIDARFRTDPATGSEISAGVSFQSMFGTKRRVTTKAD
ncbi:MAG: hypothetical protein AB8H79_22195 [Myxococcota bacterium]